MRQFTIIILTTLIFSSCDCIQQATGVVFDRQTKEPIDKVALGKYEKEDPNNSYSKRRLTDKNGLFDYHSTSGGLSGCPDLILYFSKSGYKTTKMVFASYTNNDTVYLDKVPFNRDSSISITKFNFDKLIDSCILLLQTRELKDISDEQHIQIMMCLNTIGMRSLKGGRFDQLLKVSDDKKYTQDIIKVYKEWSPNRGMGFYFHKLKMELYGTPSPYAVYKVTE